MTETTEDLGPLVARDTAVQSLQQAVMNAPRDINILRMTLVNVIKQNGWADRIDRAGRRVRHDTFVAFIREPLTKGLGSSPETIRRLIADYPEAVVAFEQAIARGPGAPEGNRNAVKDREEKTTVDNSNGCIEPRPTGTTAAAAIRRLSKDRPDLLEEVKAGNLSPHRAMVQAGFRKVPTPYEVLCRAWDKASPEERERFLDEKNQEGW